MNLIKNLAIARAKKGNGAYHHREKLPSFAPPPLLRYYTPCFLFSRHFCVPTFLAIFTRNVIGQVQSRPSKNFFFLSSKEICSFSSFFGKFLRSFRRMDEYNFFAKNFTEDYESWTHIFYLIILWIFRIVVEGEEEGKKKNCFLWNTGKTEYLFVCLFIYLFIFNFVCFLLKHRAFEIKIKQYFVFIKCTAHNVVNNKMKIISISR